MEFFYCPNCNGILSQLNFAAKCNEHIQSVYIIHVIKLLTIDQPLTGGPAAPPVDLDSGFHLLIISSVLCYFTTGCSTLINQHIVIVVMTIKFYSTSTSN